MYVENTKKFITEAKKLYDWKRMSRQLLYIAGAIFLFAFLGRFLSSSIAHNINAWPIVEFSYTSLPHDFVIEQFPQGITATLTNTNPTEKISVGAAFTLAKLDENGYWREFPFRRDWAFGVDGTDLAPGYSARFTLTEDMLRLNLIPGTYRIIANVHGAYPVWAEFELQPQ